MRLVNQRDNNTIRITSTSTSSITITSRAVERKKSQHLFAVQTQWGSISDNGVLHYQAERAGCSFIHICRIDVTFLFSESCGNSFIKSLKELLIYLFVSLFPSMSSSKLLQKTEIKHCSSALVHSVAGVCSRIVPCALNMA